MRIIIIGAGEIGYNLAKNLSYEKHDVAIIEENQERYARAADSLDVQAIWGSGTSFKVLEQAELRKADMLVGATTTDEVNLISSIIAKKYGVEKTIARIKNLEFLNKSAPLNQDELGRVGGKAVSQETFTTSQDFFCFICCFLFLAYFL